MKNYSPNTTRTRVNDDIRISKVLLIDENGKNHGEVSNSEAKDLAFRAGLDLVEVQANARPPVCVIMDYGKYKFEKSKKENKKPVLVKEKEVRFRYVIAEHDLETKLNQAKRFLDQNNKVKLVVEFKRREYAHKKEGFILLDRCLIDLKDYCLEGARPQEEGKYIICKLEPRKK